jgi:DNA-directed RNA polymerase specialized sigma24 family protein
MEAFIDRVIERFRQQVWDLLSRGPVTDAGAHEEAEYVHKLLSSRDRHDLERDPEGHVFAAIANLLNVFGAPRQQPGSALRDSTGMRARILAPPPGMDEQAVKDALATQLRDRFNELPAPCRATLILHRRDRIPLDEIAELLQLPVDEVEEHLRVGLRHCASVRLTGLQ